VEIVEYLLRRGANPGVKYMEKFTPLLVAVQQSKIPVIEALLGFGVEVTREEKEQLKLAPMTIQRIFVKSGYGDIWSA
jgi:hypothetical protein